MDLAALQALPRAAVVAYLADLPEQQLLLLRWRLAWRARARDKQLPPPDSTPAGRWLIWMLMSGRGFGKTLSGANWLGLEACTDMSGEDNISFVVAPTNSDLVGTCFEGPTGLISVIPQDLIADYNRSSAVSPAIHLTNGGLIRGFSSIDPDRLRGPQCRRAWCEEVGSWRNGVSTWNMLMFGARLGNNVRIAVTSTPKPKPLVSMLVKHPKAVIIRGSTYENKDNLADAFLDEILKHEGTRLGRQEIHGELIDPEEMGIIRRSWIRLWPHARPLPTFTYLIMSLDTAFTEKTMDKKSGDPDYSACTVWGVFHEKTLTATRSVVTRKKALPSIMLLDAWQDHLGFPDLVRRVRAELKARYGAASVPLVRPAYGPAKLAEDGRLVDLVVIEDKGSGISLRQQLEQDGIVAHPFNPGNADKLARLHEVSPVFARGRVWTVESAKNPGHPRGWAEPVVEQLCTYTGEDTIEHDDLMDTVTQALRVAVKHRLLRAVDEETVQRELDKEAEKRVLGMDPDSVDRGSVVARVLNGHANGHAPANPYAS